MSTVAKGTDHAEFLSGPRALGFYQKQVMYRLANRGASSCVDWAAWTPMTEQQVRGAVARLARRGLVDPAGWDSQNARTYCLTRLGREVVDLLDEPEPEEDG